MSEQLKFVYKLRGGPFDGKQISGRDDLWKVEFYHHDPYAENSSALVIYGARDCQFGAATRVLSYWSSKPCDPKKARSYMPEFRSS